ncbi:MAG: DUF6049 family protein [Acidimicrobiia bacterium]|nr:DUF6049 family protein [Acidimicrobiia bacterium]
MTDRRVRALLVSFSLIAAVAITTFAFDRPAGSAGVGGSLELVSQSPWVGGDGTFRVDIVLAGADAGSTLDLAIHNRVQSRSSFRRGIDEEVFRAELHRTEPIDVGGTGQAVVSLSVPLARLPNDDDRVAISEPGVYPVEVSLRNPDGELVDTLITHLIRPPETPTETPLNVGTIVPIDVPPALRPDGTRVISTNALAEFDATVGALEDVPGVPLSIDIHSETIDAIGDERRAQFRGAIAGRQIIANPYVPVDATAWIDSGLESEFVEMLAVGIGRAGEGLGTQAQLDVWPAQATLTPATLSLLGAIGVTQLIVTETQVETLDEDRFPLTLTQLFDVIDANGQAYPTAAVDGDLQAHFTGGEDPALAANHLLADLAILFFDQPTIARGAVVSPPDDWVPSATFLRTLLAGLDENPILDAVTLGEFFGTVTSATEAGQQADLGLRLQRDLVAEPAEDLAVFARQYTETAAELFSYGSILEPDNPDLVSFNDRLLVAGSSDLQPGQADAYLTELRSTVGVTTGSIDVRPPPDRVTLAARDGNIPLVIDNRLDQAVSILITMSSDKLEFPQGAERTVTLAPGTNAVELPVSARTSGDSILDIRFSSPDRSIALGSTRVLVRSTAISGVALVIAAVALAFLLWWWLHTRRTRRPNQRLIVVPDSPDRDIATVA